MAREHGYLEEVAKIIERHIGAGITVEEAREMGLPPRDYVPSTPEEKIVSYADNLTTGSGLSSFESGLEAFKKVLGEDHPAIEKFMAQHREIQDWINR